jgi:hypothetical protein
MYRPHNCLHHTICVKRSSWRQCQQHWQYTWTCYLWVSSHIRFPSVVSWSYQFFVVTRFQSVVVVVVLLCKIALKAVSEPQSMLQNIFSAWVLSQAPLEELSTLPSLLSAGKGESPPHIPPLDATGVHPSENLANRALLTKLLAL